MVYRYKHKVVRDLAWVIASPPLFINSEEFKEVKFLDDDFFTKEFEKNRDLLNSLDDEPTPLLEHVRQNNSRLLGKYFENLVGFWLLNSRDKKLLASNLQVRSGERTIGEIDFLFKDKLTDINYHLEAAGKFFMGFKDIPGWSNFIGPNTNDRLDKKMNKLLNEQIKLCSKPLTKEILKEKNISEPVNPVVWFKGYLFYYHSNFRNESFTLPNSANPRHIKGWWFYQSAKYEIIESNKHQWVVLQRMDWVSQVYNPDEASVMNSGQLLYKLDKYFAKNNYPLLLAELVPDESGILTEHSRGFVVSDKWPFAKKQHKR